MSFFQLEERNSSVRQEVLAGCTTFLTLSYIIFVNPLVLEGAGMDTGAVLVATCLAAAFGSAVMGLYANYPIALVPGMGLNAYFAAVAVGTLGLSWQVGEPGLRLWSWRDFSWLRLCLRQWRLRFRFTRLPRRSYS